MTAALPCADAARIPDGERIYAIGDVHGRLDLFERLIARIRDDNAARAPANTRIIMLGDVIDRGGDSARLVERCRLFAERTDRFVMLKGNHEAMMVHALRGSFPALAVWLRNGGAEALESWGVAQEIVATGASPGLLDAARAAVPRDVIAWLDARPLSIEAGDYLFVHAGVRPGVALASQSEEDMLWIRNECLDAPDHHGRVIVHGHSITPEGVEMRHNRIGIDTGAYRTDVLTALALEGAERWTLATERVTA